MFIKKEDIVKEHFKNTLNNKLKEKLNKKGPPGLTKQKPSKRITNITDETVNGYIKENQIL